MVNRFFYPYLGGVEFHILNLSQCLMELGCTVSVACQPQAGLPSHEHWRGLSIHRVRGLGGLRSVMRRGVDVVHAHMPRNLCAAAGLAMARRARLPTVFTPHCFYPSLTFPRRTLKAVVDKSLTKAMFRWADCTISLTQQDRADAVARGLQPDRSITIPNSVRLGELAKVPASDFRATFEIEHDFVLHVGRFDQVKNIDFIVRCHREVADLDLVLVGQDDGALPVVRALVSACGLTKRVHIIERARFADVCSAYCQARAVVMASSYEGLPTVLLEAMYFGSAVVASRVGGIPFLLDENGVGHSYGLLDRVGYLEALAAAVWQTKERQRAARRLIEEKYSWEVNAPRILRVYRRLAEDTRWRGIDSTARR